MFLVGCVHNILSLFWLYVAAATAAVAVNMNAAHIELKRLAVIYCFKFDRIYQSDNHYMYLLNKNDYLDMEKLPSWS